MSIDKESIEEQIKKLSSVSEHSETKGLQILQLLESIGINKEILKNPNNNVIHDDLYQFIMRLSSNCDVEVKGDKVRINAVENVYLDNDNRKCQVTIVAENGDLSVQCFYDKQNKEEAVLKSYELTAKQKLDGDTYTRTLYGKYSLKDIDGDEYQGNGDYTINEFASNGIQTQTRGIRTHNEPKKSQTALDYYNLLNQEKYVNTYISSLPISAKTSNDFLFTNKDSPFLSEEYLIKRELDNIEKYEVMDYTKGEETRTGVSFAFFDEGGVTSIHRFGVGNNISEETYQAQRDEFYSNPQNVEDLKEKSELAKDQIEELYQKYNSEKEEKVSMTY